MDKGRSFYPLLLKTEKKSDDVNLITDRLSSVSDL